jgi:prepilin-type N-terminal cleavage/methylation domain-containing protein
MPSAGARVYRQGGFTLAELLVVLTVLGVVGAASAPSVLRYWQTSVVQAGARELASAMNLGRQLAISRKSPVCVDVVGAGVRLRLGTCSGPLWTGSVTDAAGTIAIADRALQISSNGRVIFTTLGAATPSATYTVTHPETGISRAVIVAASGRISIE